MKIEFEVYDQPVAWKRPKHFYNPKTKQGWSYKHPSKKMKPWEDLVKAVAQKHRPLVGLLEGPLLMDLSFRLLRGKSVKREWPTTVPDWDNLGKGISDNLQGIIYRNDSQIVVFRMRKIYSTTPGVKVLIEEM